MFRLLGRGALRESALRRIAALGLAAAASAGSLLASRGGRAAARVSHRGAGVDRIRARRRLRRRDRSLSARGVSLADAGGGVLRSGCRPARVAICPHDRHADDRAGTFEHSGPQAACRKSGARGRHSSLCRRETLRQRGRCRQRTGQIGRAAAGRSLGGRDRFSQSARTLDAAELAPQADPMGRAGGRFRCRTVPARSARRASATGARGPRSSRSG